MGIFIKNVFYFSLKDIDECERGTHSCKINFVCQNTKGSFYCESKQRCMDGFLQDPEGNCVGECNLSNIFLINILRSSTIFFS